MTKAEFYDWKRHPVTFQVYTQLNEQVKMLKEELAQSAGIDPLKDRFKVGYIAAFNDLLLMAPEEDE